MREHVRTEQEDFWAGEFGNQYLQRNALNSNRVAQYLGTWASILRHCSAPISTILELGANVGINLRALSMLLPQAELTGVEINSQAADILRNTLKLCVNSSNGGGVIESSLFEFSPERTWDFVFTAGVLIHINPDLLPAAYGLMAKASARYVCMVEYYNPVPAAVSYRGHAEKLFKRDFAGEFLDAYPEYTLRGYGFVYKRDTMFSGDDSTWFLLERTQSGGILP